MIHFVTFNEPKRDTHNGRDIRITENSSPSPPSGLSTMKRKKKKKQLEPKFHKKYPNPYDRFCGNRLIQSFWKIANTRLSFGFAPNSDIYCLVLFFTRYFGCFVYFLFSRLVDLGSLDMVAPRASSPRFNIIKRLFMMTRIFGVQLRNYQTIYRVSLCSCLLASLRTRDTQRFT